MVGFFGFKVKLAQVALGKWYLGKQMSPRVLPGAGQAEEVFMKIEVFVKRADVVDFSCDVLVLKYAQEFYGADAQVVGKLSLSRGAGHAISPDPGEHVMLDSKGKVGARQVLFVGVPVWYEFDYAQIREFVRRSMQIIAEEAPTVKHVATTMHGVGFGLDERESFLAEIAGLADAFSTGSVPPSLAQVTIVERNRGRADRLKQIIKDHIPLERVRARHMPDTDQMLMAYSLLRQIDAGIRSRAKPHIFVAMPFSEDMEDVYIFGVQGPVNAAGYLCERVDRAIFTGDVLEHMKLRIETAALVIADLTSANPNVYLEVGYAWGKKRPTLLLAKKGEEPRFDARGHRYIVYKNIADLSEKLKADLSEMEQLSQRKG